MLNFMLPLLVSLRGPLKIARVLLLALAIVVSSSWIFNKQAKAVTAVDYGLIADLVKGVIVTGLTTLGASLNNKFHCVEPTVATPEDYCGDERTGAAQNDVQDDKNLYGSMSNSNTVAAGFQHFEPDGLSGVAVMNLVGAAIAPDGSVLVPGDDPNLVGGYLTVSWHGVTVPNIPYRWSASSSDVAIDFSNLTGNFDGPIMQDGLYNFAGNLVGPITFVNSKAVNLDFLVKTDTGLCSPSPS